MTLWTIQSIAAWKILQREQVLFADQRYSEDLFLDAYRWMAKQMEQRIESKSEIMSLPLWAWYQWDGIERRKPDLRSSGHLPKDQRGVRIEFEQSDKRAFCYPILIYGIMSSITGICLELWLMEKHSRPSYLSTICLFSR